MILVRLECVIVFVIGFLIIFRDRGFVIWVNVFFKVLFVLRDKRLCFGVYGRIFLDNYIFLKIFYELEFNGKLLRWEIGFFVFFIRRLVLELGC